MLESTLRRRYYGVNEIKQRIEGLRNEIRKLDREDKRNLAYQETVRKRYEERKQFGKIMRAGRAVEAAGILDDYDEELLKDMLMKHRDEIRRRHD